MSDHKYETKKGLKLEIKLYTLAEMKKFDDLTGDYALHLDALLVDGKPAFKDAADFETNIYGKEAKELTALILSENGMEEEVKN